MKTKTAAVLLAATMLAAWVPTGFGGIGLNWSMGYGWLVEYGGDVNEGPGVAENNNVIWQLIYAGADNVANEPYLDAGCYLGGDDVLLAEREIPCGGGIASDGTEWSPWLELQDGNPVYVDLEWDTEGCVYQRIYQGVPSQEGGAYYFETGLIQLDTTWTGGAMLPWEPPYPQEFAADPNGEGVVVDHVIPGEPDYPPPPDIPTQTETQSTPVPVPYVWLEENASAILAANYWDYELAANTIAANGMAVWKCYVADISATDAEASFKVMLEQEDGQWVVKWSPDREDARWYTVEGTPYLGEGASWGPVTADSQFFRVLASLPDGGPGVLSANAVGLVKFTVPAGGKQMVSVPFNSLLSVDGLFKFGETDIAYALPRASQVLFWDMYAQTWSGSTKSAKGWNAATANHELSLGEGFCVKNGCDEVIEVTASGEVPSDAQLSRSYGGDGMWTVMANPYPVDIEFGETQIANDLPVGSVVYFWDAQEQLWTGGMKSVYGWDAAESNHFLRAGETFSVRSASEGVWKVDKPYTWP